MVHRTTHTNQFNSPQTVQNTNTSPNRPMRIQPNKNITQYNSLFFLGDETLHVLLATTICYYIFSRKENFEINLGLATRGPVWIRFAAGERRDGCENHDFHHFGGCENHDFHHVFRFLKRSTKLRHSTKRRPREACKNHTVRFFLILPFAGKRRWKSISKHADS
jgi:hypothetical protein